MGILINGAPYELTQSLLQKDLHPDSITDVFFTHLHFDHCGGAIQWNANRTGYEAVFKNAKYWTSESHWNWATQPNDREKASFLDENLLPLNQDHQLHFVQKSAASYMPPNELPFGILFVDGHTEKQMIPHITYQGKTLVYMADLLPTAGHIPLPYIMGYDTRPLLTLQEKKAFLDRAAQNDWYLFMQHDAHNEVLTVRSTEKGVRLHARHSFDELFI